MHIAALSSVLFAALATAESHGRPHRFHHRRALNETITSAATVEEPLTTMTVQTTVLSTIYNCGKNLTLTTCEGKHATEAQVVTQTVDLTVTVCPVADASSISKAVLATATIPASVDAKPTPSATQSEQDNSPVLTDEASAPAPTNEATSALPTDQVLTYTLGPEGSKTIVTTTIKNTQTVSEYTTLTQTYDNSPEETTTLSSTITSTRTVTVPATAEQTQAAENDSAEQSPSTDSADQTQSADSTQQTQEANIKTPVEDSEESSPSSEESSPSSEENSPSSEENSPSSEENSPSSEESSPSSEASDCPAPVTVTIAASTIYVTVSPEASAEATQVSAEVTQASSETVQASAEVTPAPAASSSADDENNAPQSTVFVIPQQQYSNNTMPHATGAPGSASSGFLTQTRPYGTGSAIKPAPTAGHGFLGLF